MKYKLRAEAPVDIAIFVMNTHEELISYTMKGIDMFGYELEFETNISIEDIRSVLEQVADSHVMNQTLSLSNQYTGIRNYNI